MNGYKLTKSGEHAIRQIVREELAKATEPASAERSRVSIDCQQITFMVDGKPTTATVTYEDEPRLTELVTLATACLEELRTITAVATEICGERVTIAPLSKSSLLHKLGVDSSVKLADSRSENTANVSDSIKCGRCGLVVVQASDCCVHAVGNVTHNSSPVRSGAEVTASDLPASTVPESGSESPAVAAGACGCAAPANTSGGAA